MSDIDEFMKNACEIYVTAIAQSSVIWRTEDQTFEISGVRVGVGPGRSRGFDDSTPYIATRLASDGRIV